MGFLLLALLAIFLFASMLFAAKALPNLRQILFNRDHLFESQSEAVTCPSCKKTFKRAPGNSQTCPACYTTF